MFAAVLQVITCIACAAALAACGGGASVEVDRSGYIATVKTWLQAMVEEDFETACSLFKKERQGPECPEAMEQDYQPAIADLFAEDVDEVELKISNRSSGGPPDMEQVEPADGRGAPAWWIVFEEEPGKFAISDFGGHGPF